MLVRMIEFLREKYNKKVGYLDENEEIVFLPGESYEKYENQKNMYGKKITYSYRIIGNDVYTNIMTPEIDYSSINNVEEMRLQEFLLYSYIEDKCIKEFYLIRQKSMSLLNSIVNYVDMYDWIK